MTSGIRLQELFDKYLQQQCTAAEKEELAHLLQDPESREGLSQRMLSIWEQIKEEQKTYPVDWDKMYQAITRPAAQRRFIHTLRKKSLYRAAAAIGAMLVLSAGWYAWRHPSGPEKAIIAKQTKHTDISPGGNKATLTLSNGRTIILNQTANGTLATQGVSRVIKLDSGELSYRNTGEQAFQTAVQYNTLSTPRGGQYRLQLPDGTKVWLNAASSIHYPTAFTGKDRQVEITGEAYFEVAQEATRPFIVTAGNMEVKVLGTHFNINAYENETSINTTLLEGKVQIESLTDQKQAKIITPGQMVKLNRAGEMKLVRRADVEEEVAWKNGLFIFHNDDLQSVMRKLARWYDVQVDYKENSVPESHFTGAIKRQENISKVLKMMELTGGARFNIDGRKIVVSY